MPRSIHRWILAAACTITLRAMAQVPPPADDKSAPPGVSVPDSPGASERLDKARDKESQKQWKTAAEFYQEALKLYPARVVPVNRDPDKGIYFYSGIAPIVQERLAKWPADGIKIYNTTYGQTAADLLAAAKPGDTAALRLVFWNYFITDAGKSAGIRLMDSDLESGDFQAAKWIGDRLLALHPGLLGDRAMIRYRTAIAAHNLGDADRAAEQLAAIKQEDPTTVSSIGGKDMLLVDSLTAVLNAPAPLPTTRPTDADTYPSFGGAGSRGDISSSTAKPGASLNSVPLALPEFSGVMGNQRSTYQTNDSYSLSNYQAMGIMPVVDAGALFFQDGRSVYAVDTDSGSPLTGWLNTYSGDRNGRYKLSTFGRARDEELTLTVTPTAVLAVMGQPDHGGLINNQFAMPPSTTPSIKLVCLDRDTGKERWTRTPAELPEAAAALRTGDYYGTPVVVPQNVADDSLLVIARGGKDNQFDDCYVVCLSIKTGQYRWSTYVGSATRSFDMEGLTARDPSQMALANGRVFVMTNLGTVAALDPADGRMIWLNGYPRDNSANPEAVFLRARRFPGNPGLGMGNPKPWAHNPVIVSGGSVFVLPDDNKSLFVYDAGSGEMQNRLPMSAYDNADVLLGVRDGGVCLTSEKSVAILDWKKYSEDNPKLAYRWNESDITSTDQSTVCGRGFITSDSIFVPTKSRLKQISWRTGKTLTDYPARGSFNTATGQGPGNLLVTAHNVVVAGETRVDVYTDLALVQQKFETAIAADPKDPQPRVKYAEALFAGGQMPQAMQRIDEAIDLLGGKESMRSGKGRSMIFTTMLDFAARAENNADKTNRDQNIAQENELFDRAKIAADTPLEQATYRLHRAAFNFKYEDYTSDVNLCQEILSDDGLRNTLMPDESTAGSNAEEAIAKAVNANHSAYSAVEVQAGDALKTALATNDPNQLLNVAIIYPNSNSAITARQEAVQRFEAANQPEKAIDVLRRMYTSAADNTARAHLLESITADFLATPDGTGPAIDRLCRASRLISPDTKLSQKLLLSDGTVLNDISLGQAVATLRKIQSDQDTARLPDFHIARGGTKDAKPFVTRDLQGAPVIASILAVVHPLNDFNRPDQILTWSAAGLGIYPAGQTTPVATVSAVDKSPLAAAFTGDHWMVWTTDQVFGIGSDGKPAWTFSAAHLPALDISTGGDSVIDFSGDPGPDDPNNVNNNINNVRVINGQIVQVRGGRLVRINQLPVPAPVAPPVQSGDEQIVALQPAGAQLILSTSIGRILSLDGKSGQIRWQTRPADHAADQLLANPHFTVVRMDDPGGSQIAVYDTPTGRVIGRGRYGLENTPRQLVNVALSEESTLGITLMGELMIKDLYDPWKEPPKDLASQINPDTTQFAGLGQADQLVVRGGRLSCLYASGTYARAYDLSQNSEPTLPLATAAGTMDVTLRMVGSRMFVHTSKGMLQYNLADKTDHYDVLEEQNPSSTKTAELLVGKDYAVVLLDPVDRGPLGSPLVTLLAIRRSLAPNTTRESGFVDWDPAMQSQAGITDWLAAEATVYCLTKDGNLHLLQGSRP